MPSVNNDLTYSNLLAMQPGYYATSKVMQNIDTANAAELNNLNAGISNTNNNLCIYSCNNDTLTRWEKILKLINSNNNVVDSDSYRLSRILARIRGQGTFTAAFLQNVAKSFENSEVDVIEDNANYAFTVKFVGQKGVPPNLDDLKSVIEELKPAHLAVNYVFMYLIFSEYDSYNNTWSKWDSLNLTWDKFTTYKQ